MSLDEQGRYDVVNYRLEKARQTIEQAKTILALGYWEIVANRLYYAAYYAASALLIANSIRVKSHEGVIQQLGLHFIKPGLLSNDIGKLYRQLFTFRLKGDYEDNYNLTEEQVAPMIEPTEQLITIISNLTRQALDKRS